MILYNKDQNLSLEPYGILIPVRSSKTTKTLEALLAHPILGPLAERWHRRPETGLISKADLLRVHDPHYVERLFSKGLEQELMKTFELVDEKGHYHRYAPDRAELPLSRLFKRILDTASGTWQCCRLALDHGFCFFFGGGMHHAHYSQGKGFCLINDIVVALRKLQSEGNIKTAWVIDVDAHKGDGTAALTSGDDSIRTLSLHMASGWPLDEPEYDEQGRLNPSFIPSDIDVPVKQGEEDRYLEKLQAGLDELDTFARPDLALVVSGADPLELDELESARELKLTLEQLLERDRLIYRFLKERGLPRAYVMAGGYGSETWRVYAGFLEWALLDGNGPNRSR